MELVVRNQAFSVDDAHPEFWHLLKSDKWEPETLNVFDAYLDKDTVFVDVGAWIGPTSLYAATKVKRVISIEADPEAISFLSANVKKNAKLVPNIEILHRAISAHQGTLKLGSKGERGDSMSSALFQNSGDTWEVECITPEEIISRVRDDKKLFIKMDIEGGEYLLSASLHKFAERANTTLLVAFHPGFLPGNKVRRFLKSLILTRDIFKTFRGFSILRVESQKTTRSFILNLFHRLGFCFYPANDTFLFIKR